MSHELMSHKSSYESGQRFSKLKMADVVKPGVSSVVRSATIFVSRIHFNRRTSSEVEIIQRTLVTADDLGIFLVKWVGKDGHLASSQLITPKECRTRPTDRNIT